MTDSKRFNSQDMAQQKERQTWMAILAKSAPETLEKQVSALGKLPKYSFLRSPEIGLTMVRGRAGGTGQVFNLGEMTVTRCVVKLGEISGFGYVGGRSRLHAELAAVCDALLQDPEWCDRLKNIVIEPLKKEAITKQELQQRQTAATRVNFLTMKRGE